MSTEPTREYRCPQCDRWAKWTDGIEESDDDTPDEFWCQTCGAETPIEDMDSRPQDSAGDTNTAGTGSDMGTGVAETPGPFGRDFDCCEETAPKTPVDIAARILVGADWDDDEAWGDGEREHIRSWAEGVDDELRTVHYREVAVSLERLGHTAAARAVRSAAKGLEDGDA